MPWMSFNLAPVVYTYYWVTETPANQIGSYNVRIVFFSFNQSHLHWLTKWDQQYQYFGLYKQGYINSIVSKKNKKKQKRQYLVDLTDSEYPRLEKFQNKSIGLTFFFTGSTS